MNSVLELIQCPVCMNTNSDPMVLSCGHSICSDCVEKMIARNQRKCPTCNAGEINSNLQLSRATQSLVGTFHSLATMKCPNCEEIVRVSDMFKSVQDFETLIGVSQEHLKPWMESTATQWLKDNTLLLDKVRQQLVRFDQTVLHVAKVLSQAAECERAAFQNYERVLQRLRAHYDALGDVLCVGDRPSVDSTLVSASYILVSLKFCFK
ncbi:unnamed protein product [Soboliphyme baturini]|uniref:RING-type domain-containing protein n=1 Tax=Soboliphyme baturini TaxID=241478 RepID=A0A183IQT2_9BILA|nr:unnamed protein product [Soboliphyme baturini]